MLHVVNRIREVVRFELSKEIEKYVSRFVRSEGQRKNPETAWGIKPQTFGLSTHLSYFILQTRRY